MTNPLKNIWKIYTPSLNKSKSNQIKDLFSKINIDIPNHGLIFSFDEFKQLTATNNVIGNITMDYSLILEYSLSDLKSKYQNDDEFSTNQLEIIESIENLINRIINKLNSSNQEDKDEYIEYFENIKTKKKHLHLKKVCKEFYFLIN